MPYPLIPTALGICFLLMWALIGGMTFRSSHLAVRNERDAETHVLPLPPRRANWRPEPAARLLSAGQKSITRAAS